MADTRSPLAHLLTSPRFKEYPLCADYEPEMWWYDRRESPTSLLALNVCHRCPAQDACLEHAVTMPELEGIWGGTFPDERKRIRASRKAVA